MNTKNCSRLLKAVFVVCAALAIVLFCVWLGGCRLNLTPSLPKGLYRLGLEPVRRGDSAAFCLAAENPYSPLAKERGYLGPGNCPSGLRPLLKHLAGLPGDLLEISVQGISINGRLMPGTARPTRDRQGRTLPPSLLKNGEIPPGQALVLSREHSGGFDSRHFGLVPLSSLKKARPVLTIKRDTSVSVKGF